MAAAVWLLIEETIYEGNAIEGVYATLDAARAAADARGYGPWRDDGDGGLDDGNGFAGHAIRRWEVVE